MKSYTDLEQSKVLAKILSPESADMYYMEISCNNYTVGVLQRLEKDMLLKQAEYYKMFPCWSLAALLGALPLVDLTIPQLVRTPKTLYRCIYSNNLKSHASDNPVDACYNMIIDLHEQNLL